MKKIIFTLTIIFAAIVFNSTQVTADSFLPPSEFEIVSADGTMVFRWVPSEDYRSARAGVYRNGELLYAMENLPTMGVSEHNFFFSQDFERLIVFPATGFTVAMEFYVMGELVKTHYIADLISDMDRVSHSVTRAWWRGVFPTTRESVYHIYHLVEQEALRFITIERIVYEVSLTTGEILSRAPYDTPLVEGNITVRLNGRIVDFPDQQPLIQNGRTLVPVSAVFETMGFNVEWVEHMRTVFLRPAVGDYYIEIEIGHSAFLVVRPGTNPYYSNASVHTLEVPAQIIGGRTMLPLRAVLESVGYQLTWDEATRTILITS